MQEAAQPLHVLQAGGRLEAAVEVDACQLRVVEPADGTCTAGVEASAQEERCAAGVAVEQVPVELLSRAARLGRLALEEEVVAGILVGFRSGRVVRSGQMKGLDDLQPVMLAQGPAVRGKLLAVQLHISQSETVGIRQHGFLGFVDEHSDALCPAGQVVGHLTDEAGRGWIEYEADEVHAQLLDLTDVLAVGHAAYFDKQVHKAAGFDRWDICWMNVRSSSPGRSLRMKRSPMSSPR